jgi:hypothetical protein
LVTRWSDGSQSGPGGGEKESDGSQSGPGGG